MGYLDEEEFRLRVLALLVQDRNFLKQVGSDLEVDDFRPIGKEGGGKEIWATAEIALDFWHKYREPIGGMLRVEMLEWARRTGLGEKGRERLFGLLEKLRDRSNRVAPEVVADRILDFKKAQAKSRAVEELIASQERGELTDDKWLEICREGVEKFGGPTGASGDFFEGLEARMTRRMDPANRKKAPLLLIDPIDEKVQAIARGQLGLLLAFYKMGKSLALNHISLAYVLQRLNVLHVTLEDPSDVVEDRMDAAIAQLPIKRLGEKRVVMEKRFNRFRRLLRAKLKLVDGTGGGITVPKIEEIWERERNRGWAADAVVIDYDDEVKATIRRTGESARRMEFADIYRDLRRFAAEKDLLLWTASQAARRAEGKKVVMASMAAEDLSKIRKATMTLTIGQGDWGTDSRYLYVAAHKTDRQGVGGTILSDPGKGIFYLRDETLTRRKLEKRKGGEK